ncbi:hypothetical protein TNCV_2884131 [Trichonephila clavipes]|nr:hypothetical protein TNCV_2884131 [Trichonephila clavipes]
MAVWLRHEPGWHAGPAGRLEVGRMQRGRPTRHENEQTIYGRSRDRRRRKISHELAQQQGGQKDVLLDRFKFKGTQYDSMDSIHMTS